MQCECSVCEHTRVIPLCLCWGIHRGWIYLLWYVLSVKADLSLAVSVVWKLSKIRLNPKHTVIYFKISVTPISWGNAQRGGWLLFRSVCNTKYTGTCLLSELPVLLPPQQIGICSFRNSWKTLLCLHLSHFSGQWERALHP